MEEVKVSTPAESFNRETYQKNAELKQELIEKDKVITGLMNEYRQLEEKYEPLVQFVKVTL
jgi:hypothetical protein